MIGFKVVNLDLLLQVKSEEQIGTILNDFESPLNPDIENFLKYKAVEFSKAAIAKTYLVIFMISIELYTFKKVNGKIHSPFCI